MVAAASSGPKTCGELFDNVVFAKVGNIEIISSMHMFASLQFDNSTTIANREEDGELNIIATVGVSSCQIKLRANCIRPVPP